MEPLLHAALRRDRLIVGAALALVVALAWGWLAAGAGMMEPMGDMLMPMSSGPWTLAHAALVFAMWAVMMAAMMLPGAAPMILAHAAMAARRGAADAAATGAFALGYLAVWTAFSLVATALQAALERAALLSPMMEATSVALAGGVLVGAGLYQFTAFKRACLVRCRSPLAFFLSHWRPGVAGAFAMGLRHGSDCLGCCWLLMALLFVGGVMNLAWIAGIAAYVAVEKFAPAAHGVGRAAGAVLVAWGLATLQRAVG